MAHRATGQSARQNVHEISCTCLCARAPSSKGILAEETEATQTQCDLALRCCVTTERRDLGEYLPRRPFSGPSSPADLLKPVETSPIQKREHRVIWNLGIVCACRSSRFNGSTEQGIHFDSLGSIVLAWMLDRLYSIPFARPQEKNVRRRNTRVLARLGIFVAARI